MLETDCIIPRHVPIPHDGVYTVYGNARAVEALQRQGLTEWQIRLKLHIGLMEYRDAVYEINKKNAAKEAAKEEMMEKKRTTLTADQRQELYEAYTAKGASAEECAKQYNVGVSTVWRIVSNIRKASDTSRKSHINPEFDAAVDQMIAESKAEVIPAPAPALPAAVPAAVLCAVKAAVAEKECAVCEMLGKIRMMQQQVEQIRTEIAQLRTWTEEVGG